MSRWNAEHLTAGQLLQYLDGELPSRETGRVRRHLEACWDCRAELKALEGAVDACVRYRKEVLQAHLAPPRPWPDLYPRFQEVDAGRGWVDRLRAAVSMPRAWATAMVAIALLVLLVLQFQRAPAVHAAELLAKAVAAADSQAGDQRRIEIRTRRHRIVRPGVHAAAAVDEPKELRKLFHTVQYSWDDPLSAHAFSQWRERLPRKRDEVLEIRWADLNGYRIRTTTDHGELIEATLTLAHDLRPVESRLRFRNEEWVEISELPAAPETSVQAAIAEPAPASPVSPQDPRPLSPDLATLSDELQVIAALHRIGADLGDPVEVARDGAQVVVTGAGIAPSRRREIEAALRPIARAAVRFREANPGSPVDESSSGWAGHEAGIPMPAGGRDQLEQLTAQVLDSSDALMSRAYALRRLAERYPPDLQASFGAADRSILHDLQREHAAALSRRAADLERLLQPLISSAPSAPARPPLLPGDRQAAAEDLFRAARRLEKLLAAALAGAPSELAPAQLPAAIAAAISSLRLQADAYERAIRD